MTAQAALRAAILRLAAAGIDDAPGDARRLLAHALQIPPERLTLHLLDPVSPEAAARYDAALAAREARQPVAQITGQRLFWGRPFRVTRDVLDPRPETECLVEAALSAPFDTVLDLGTGTGAILLTLLAERAGARGLGTDLSAAALEVARGNALALALDQRAVFRLSDWFAEVKGRFDLIVSNPPYIAADEMASLAPDVRDWEPHQALTPGGDGLDAYRAIAAEVAVHLNPGGRLLVEIGPTQATAVRSLFHNAGMRALRTLRDIDGRDRVIAAYAP